MDICGIYNMGMLSNPFYGVNHLAGSNYLSGVNYLTGNGCLNGVNYLTGSAYLNNVNCLDGGNTRRNVVNFQKAVENILENYVNEDTSSEEKAESFTDGKEELSIEEKWKELLERVEQKAAQKKCVQTDASWWELRTEHSEFLKKQAETYHLKNQDARKWERQQARKEEREALKEEYRQVWRWQA